MKLHRHLAAAIAAAITSIASASATVSIAVTPPASTGDSDVAAFVFEVLEVQLSGMEAYDLVDRERLSNMLAEQSLGAAGMTQDNASEIGKLVGAKYYVFGEAKQAGSRTAIQGRVVQVETGLLKPVLIIVPNEADPMEIGDQLATKVEAAITSLEGKSAEEAATKSVEKLELPASTKLPVLAFRIPEVSVTPATDTADPAAEKSLEDFFEENGCKMVQLSRPSQSETPGANPGAPAGAHLEGEEHEALLSEAREKGVDIIILGVATSERAARIGNFNAARARVELSAVRVSDSAIITTTSGYGVGSDLSTFVAEKKAIESATENLRVDFAEKIITAFQ